MNVGQRGYEVLRLQRRLNEFDGLGVDSPGVLTDETMRRKIAMDLSPNDSALAVCVATDGPPWPWWSQPQAELLSTALQKVSKPRRIAYFHRLRSSDAGTEKICIAQPPFNQVDPAADTLVVDHPALVPLLCEFSKGRSIAVVDPCYDHNLFVPVNRRDPDHFVVGFVGQDSQKAGSVMEASFDCWEGARAEVLSVSAFSPEGRIRSTEFVPNPLNAKRWLSRLDVLVSCSFSGLELPAAAMGIPVIGAGHPGRPLHAHYIKVDHGACSKHGNRIGELDIDSLACRLRELEINRDELDYQRRLATLSVAHLTVDASARKLSRL